MPESRKKILRISLCSVLLVLPVVLMLIFDPAARLSRWNFCTEVVDSLLLLDLPIAICMIHWFRPQWFRLKNGWYSPIPWVLLTLVGWMISAGEMYLAMSFGRGPTNGLSVLCAYLFGWSYIWITMIPIGLLYLLIRGIVFGIVRIRRRGLREDETPGR